MKNITNALKKYLDEALNAKTQILAWKEKNELPFFLIDSYDFFEILLFDKKCLAMIAKNESELTPAKVRKDWELVKNRWPGLCFYVQKTISSHNRLRLIKQNVPFVVPGNQLYLLELGVNLQEHFEKQFVPKKHFSPATQVVIIYALLHGLEKRNPSMLVEKLGYTHTTMTRVFNELEAAQIGKMVNEGKERWWIFQGTKRDLWEQTSVMLRSPIRNRHAYKYYPGAKMWKEPLLSGLSALAEITMINPPYIPIYAMGIDDLKSECAPNGIRDKFFPEEDADLELELWNYNPKLVTENDRVDPFSLYLSLRDTEDPRVESALEELMEKIQW